MYRLSQIIVQNAPRFEALGELANSGDFFLTYNQIVNARPYLNISCYRKRYRTQNKNQ